MGKTHPLWTEAKLLNGYSIQNISRLPKTERDEILRAAKKIEGATQRQIAKVLGISANLVFKA